MDTLGKVENWRCRALELRRVAGDMREAVTRSALLKIADALEDHARKLEAVTLLCRRRSQNRAAAPLRKTYDAA